MKQRIQASPLHLHANEPPLCVCVLRDIMLPLPSVNILYSIPFRRRGCLNRKRGREIRPPPFLERKRDQNPARGRDHAVKNSLVPLSLAPASASFLFGCSCYRELSLQAHCPRFSHLSPLWTKTHNDCGTRALCLNPRSTVFLLLL